MWSGYRQHLVPPWRGEKELAGCPVAASMPGLHGLQAVMVDSVDPAALIPRARSYAGLGHRVTQVTVL